jgi:hypothetical protein
MFSKLKPTKGSKDSVSVAEMARQERSGCLQNESGRYLDETDPKVVF